MPDDIVIRTEGLGKRYKLGALEPYRTLRDTVANVFRPSRRAQADAKYHWALRDIDLAVRQGEVLGIVGRNGSGKSTLLKLLTRITRPTEGRIAVRGRIGALLEVGTGFHPELTGRENIYLNGAVLGMSRADISRRFDQIVDFAGVEEYLDTPVKRYSSGMNVRLAFAVAAHLEPEILVIDEVLAVGDAAFQRKCLGRMGEVASEGRTVLFVSHQMEAVLSLCSRAIWLNDGTLMDNGTPQSIVARYISATQNTLARKGLLNRPDRIAPGPVEFREFRFENSKGEASSSFATGDTLRLVAPFENKSPNKEGHVVLNLAIRDSLDQLVLYLSTDHGKHSITKLPREGSFICALHHLALVPGTYTIDYGLRINGELNDKLLRAAAFEVIPGDFHGNGTVTKAARGTSFLHAESWEVSESESVSV